MAQINQKETSEKIGRRGILVENLRPRVIQEKGIPAREFVRDPVLIVTPQSGKELDLPSGGTNLKLNELPEAQMLWGGQDCVGAVTFDGGDILAMLVVADGCSFADRKEAAQAAKYTVATVLSAGKSIALGEIGKRPIQISLAASLSIAHKEISRRYPRGATTASVAAIAAERRPNGTKRLVCYVASCGDTSINILGTNPDGTVFMKRLNGHADLLERIASAQHINFFGMDPTHRKEVRERILTQAMVNGNMTREEAEKVYMLSGINEFLGTNGEKKSRFAPEAEKYDVSSLLAKGVTNIKIFACSDNAGDKIPREHNLDLYRRSGNNRIFSEELLKIMMQRDQDDGCSGIIDVGAVKI
mgnify:CR=1 FL=1